MNREMTTKETQKLKNRFKREMCKRRIVSLKLLCLAWCLKKRFCQLPETTSHHSPMSSSSKEVTATDITTNHEHHFSQSPIPVSSKAIEIFPTACASSMLLDE